MERRYRGIIKSHHAFRSESKGTPGIELQVSVTARQGANGWEGINPMTRTVRVYFPDGGDHSWSVKKLAYAGHKGGSLSGMNLVGNPCELSSKLETYEGKEREKFELALPPAAGFSEPSEDAFLAIDAILQSESVEGITPVGSPQSEAPAGTPPQSAPMNSAPTNGVPSQTNEDEIPF